MKIYIYKKKPVLCKSKTILPQIQRNRFADYKLRYSKWDKTVRVIIFGLIISLVLGLVIANISVVSRKPEELKKLNSRNFKKNEINCNRNSYHSYKCINFNEENIDSLVEEINKVSVNSSDIALELSGNFLDSSINNGWLNGVEHNVTKLVISESNLKHIGAGSFANNPFYKLQYLMLQNTNIDVLRRHSFDGALLTNFEIQFSNAVHELELEEKVFEPISDTLEILAFNKYNVEEQLVNVTGDNGNTLNKLQSLDLKNNNILRLSNKSLTNIPKIRVIYLEGNGLRFIEPNTFSQLTELQLLHLNENNLEYIPDGIFDNFKGREADISIKINNWKCNCSLVWLRDFFTEYRNTLFNESDFLCDNSVDYTEVDFCTSTTSTTTPTTTTPTTTTPTTSTSSTTITTPSSSSTTTTISTTSTPPTEKPPNFGNETCNLSEPPYYGTETDSFSIKIRDGKTTLHFTQFDDKAKYKITVDPPLTSSEYLLFINANKTSEIQCIYPDQNNIRKTENNSEIFIDSLTFAETYTICLINATTFFPTDCTGLTVPKAWPFRTWLSNQNIFPVIIGICTSLLISIVLSSFIMFLCIRKYPKIIEGEDIVIVEDLNDLPRTNNLPSPSYNPAYGESSYI